MLPVLQRYVYVWFYSVHCTANHRFLFMGTNFWVFFFLERGEEGRKHAPISRKNAIQVETLKQKLVGGGVIYPYTGYHIQSKITNIMFADSFAISFVFLPFLLCIPPFMFLWFLSSFFFSFFSSGF